MEKEIGGYLEMENLRGQEYHSKLLRLNLGRTALLFALEALHVKKIWLPYYLCDSVTEVCNNWEGEVGWYPVNKDFTPVLPPFDEEGTFLYAVNYYGQLDTQDILALKKRYSRILVDNTHHFFQRPVDGIPTLYSLRKYFGLPDGAYLYLPGSSEDIIEKLNLLPKDISGGRMEHLLGRYETSGSAFYSSMLTTAHSFCREPVKRMSLLTENLLQGIDYEQIREKRNENYQFLAKALDRENRFHPRTPDGAFAYPFYTTSGLLLRKELAAEHIYIPTYWSNVISSMPQDSLEASFSADILPLPCDQRYSIEDMSRVITTLKKHLAEGGSKYAE